MASAAAVMRGRRLAERLMTTTVQAKQPGDSTTVAAGNLRPGERFTDIGDPCAAQVMSNQQPQGRTVSVGGAERVVIESGLRLPVTAYLDANGLQIKSGWRFVVTAIGPTDDPALLGRTYQVTEVGSGTQATARRLDVVEV